VLLIGIERIRSQHAATAQHAQLPATRLQLALRTYGLPHLLSPLLDRPLQRVERGCWAVLRMVLVAPRAADAATLAHLSLCEPARPVGRWGVWGEGGEGVD